MSRMAMFFFLLYGLQTTEGAGCHCYNNDTTRCYRFENREQVPFRTAASRCRVGGGNLAVLDTLDIFDYVFNRMIQQNYWIGLLKVTGSDPVQARWFDGQYLNLSLYPAYNFQLDDSRHDCVRMRYATWTRVADYPCLSSYFYVCQYYTAANTLRSGQRHFPFDVAPGQVMDTPWSLDLAQCPSTPCSSLSCSLACTDNKSCRSFSYSHLTGQCRLHSDDLTSLTSFRSHDPSWISMGKERKEPANCEDVVTLQPCVLSGAFTIYPSLALPPFPVYCVMGDDDVNWILLMRKTDNANFERTFADYVTGFGDLEGDFWLGLERMSVLTPPWLEYQLYVQFPSGSGDVNATYSNFAVTQSSGGDYVISYDAFTSGAEDYLSGLQGNAFGSRPSGCPLCQAGWWEVGVGATCHCDPSLMKIRMTRTVHG